MLIVADNDSFVERLRSRKMAQWTLAYLGGAWLLLQVLELIADNLGWPAVVMRGALVLAVCGLLTTLVLAWYHGEQGRQKVSGTELMMLGLLLVIAGSALALVRGSAGGQPDLSADTTNAPGVSMLGHVTAEVNSIAVLPFLNLSPDASVAYVGDGLAEELLNTLARVPGLRVAARTSSFAFKESSAGVSEIGRQLRVAHVLEGSVRVTADRLRVYAQLVEVETGYQRWSSMYDRTPNDLFVVQEELAHAITRALQYEIPGALVPVQTKRPDVDFETYNRYLRAMHLYHLRGGDNLNQATQLFREVIASHPRFAPAHAGLAFTLTLRSFGEDPEETAVLLAQGKAAGLRAIEIDPELADGYAVLGWIADRFDRDWDAAEQYFATALRLNPNHVDALHFGSLFLGRSMGRHAEAIALAERALAVAPVSGWVQAGAGVVFEHARDYRRAAELYEGAPVRVAGAYLWSGRYDELTDLLPELAAEDAAFMRCIMYARTQHPDARVTCAAALPVLTDMPPGPRLMKAAMVHAALGDNARAVDALEQHLREERFPWVLGWKTHESLDPLRSEPRFQQMLRSLRLE
jgi:TolB-like protein